MSRQESDNREPDNSCYTQGKARKQDVRNHSHMPDTHNYSHTPDRNTYSHMPARSSLRNTNSSLNIPATNLSSTHPMHKLAEQKGVLTASEPPAAQLPDSF